LNSEEDELIRLAACGNQEAFRQLWETHHAVVMAAALRLCHRQGMAEEITQGAFLLAWKGLAGFHAGSSFRPWLMRIAYRHALDVMEKQRVYAQPLSLDEIMSVYEQAQLSVQADMQEQVARRDEVRQALASLNVDQRRVIALRYGADLTETAIAEILNWPLGTVKSRLNRARESLREQLADEWK
jgi:RNA polymerase sigma factor (sigma-70 family)